MLTAGPAPIHRQLLDRFRAITLGLSKAEATHRNLSTITAMLIFAAKMRREAMCCLHGYPPASTAAGGATRRARHERGWSASACSTQGNRRSLKKSANSGCCGSECFLCSAQDRNRAGNGVELPPLGHLRETGLNHQRDQHTVGIGLGIRIAVQFLDGRPEQLAHQP